MRRSSAHGLTDGNRCNGRQMQALGWRYVLFPGLFGALLLMAAAAVTDELARAARALCAEAALTRCACMPFAAQKRRFVFELADVVAVLRGGARAAKPAAARA